MQLLQSNATRVGDRKVESIGSHHEARQNGNRNRANEDRGGPGLCV